MCVYKTDYPEDYKYYCRGYLGQILASNSKSALEKALLNWPCGDYKVINGKATGYYPAFRGRG